VYDGRGQAAKSVTKSNGKVIEAALPKLADGSYVVVWHIVSDDGHPEQGAFTFSVGAATATTANISSLLSSRTASPAIGFWFGLDRALAFLASLVLVGGVIFTQLRWRTAMKRIDVHRVLVVSGIVAVVTTLLSIPLQAAYSTGRSANFFDGGAIGDVVSARFGRGALLRAALLAVFLVVVLVRPRVSKVLTTMLVLVGLGVFATYAYAGHGDTGRLPALGFVTDMTHLGAAALWLGGIAVLVVALRDRTAEPDTADAAVGFSTFALPAIALLVLSGVVQAWRQVGSWDALWNTSYSRLLLIKTLVVLGIIILASAARNAIRDRNAARALATGGGDAAMLREVRTSVAVEAVLAVVVLAVTAALVVTPPARESAAAANRPTPQTLKLAAKGQTTDYRVAVQPALAGVNTIVVSPGHARKGFLPVTMTGVVRDPGSGAASRVTFVALEDGRWVTTAPLNSSGTWSVSFTGDTVGGRDVASVNIPIR
jgi:copper transport protein